LLGRTQIALGNRIDRVSILFVSREQRTLQKQRLKPDFKAKTENADNQPLVRPEMLHGTAQKSQGCQTKCQATGRCEVRAGQRFPASRWCESGGTETQTSLIGSFSLPSSHFVFQPSSVPLSESTKPIWKHNKAQPG
jgi:hypothetical protein